MKCFETLSIKILILIFVYFNNEVIYLMYVQVNCIMSK